MNSRYSSGVSTGMNSKRGSFGYFFVTKMGYEIDLMTSRFEPASNLNERRDITPRSNRKKNHI